MTSDLAQICPACQRGTGIQREDGVWVCAACSEEWTLTAAAIPESNQRAFLNFMIMDTQDAIDRVKDLKDRAERYSEAMTPAGGLMDAYDDLLDIERKLQSVEQTIECERDGEE